MTKQIYWVAQGISMAFFGASAIASTQKVLVRMRSPNTFQTLETQWRQSQLMSSLHSAERDLLGQAVLPSPTTFPGTQLPVSNLLGELNMAVVTVQSESELTALQQSAEVLSAEADFLIPLASVSPSENGLTEEPTIPWGIDAVKSREAWATNTTGAQGEGAKVVILDTGIDRDHPELRQRLAEGKNLFSKTTVLENAPSLAGGLLLGTHLFSSSLFSEPLESEDFQAPYPFFDEVGHGTHVAGTIAAEDDNQGVVGVAPRSKLYMGRVCGRMGCSSVAVVEGINWAIQVGADVVSMSLGGPFPSEAQREALIQAEKAGVVAIAASGNSGIKKISYPAAYPEVISVGAVDATLKRAEFSQYGPRLDVVAPGVDVRSSVPLGTGRAATVRLNNATTSIPSTSFVGSAEVEGGLQGSLAYGGLGNSDELANARGNIVLLQRGKVSFADKATNAIKAGATGVVIYNNEPGLLSGAITSDGSTLSIPVVMIEQGEGEKLAAALQAGEAQSISIATRRSDFSAMRGTSMATPHVAGVAALIRAANPKLSVAQVRQILKQSATKLKPEGDADNEYGSGLVNAQAAVSTALSLR